MSHGLMVAEKDVSGKLLFDSRNVRPQIAVGRSPAHLGLQYVTGTGITTSAGNGFLATEPLFSLNHGLGYKPKVLVYFYVVGTASYNVGKFFYGFGAADDYITYSVTNTGFSIVHIYDDTFFNNGLTSTAATVGPIRIKYAIFSNPVNNYTDPAKRL